MLINTTNLSYESYYPDSLKINLGDYASGPSLNFTANDTIDSIIEINNFKISVIWYFDE